LARRVARTLVQGKSLAVNRMQKKMFKVMKRKLMGIHALNTIRYGHIDGQPKPPWLQLMTMRKIFKKMHYTEEQISKWADSIPFEYNWWKSRGWLHAKSFQDLAWMEVPPNFDARRRLLLVESS
jgi:hypothetical protein